jgi:hypothetical protein
LLWEDASNAIRLSRRYVGLPEKGKTIALQLVSAAQSW